MEGLKLEDGKKYLDGMGDVVEVRLTHPGRDYPFTGDNELRYMADGRYLEDCHAALKPLNLISEVQ